MKISVLIPAYNAGALVGTALASVRAQSHTDWEIVVIEDGSHDDTARIVERFAASCAQSVRYENLEQNHGIGVVRSRLIESARGDALAFLDADDTWQPDHLAAAAAEIAAGADLVVSGVQTFDLARKCPLDCIPPPDGLQRNPVQTLFQGSVIVTSSCVVLTRALAGRVGAFDHELRIGEDRDYWLRCALAGARFGAARGYTCNYAKHASSSMARTYQVAEHAARFYEKYRSLSAVPARLRRRLLAKSLMNLGRLLRRHDRERSIACFRQAWRIAPFDPRIPLQLAFTRWRSFPAHAAA